MLLGVYICIVSSEHRDILAADYLIFQTSRVGLPPKEFYESYFFIYTQDIYVFQFFWTGIGQYISRVVDKLDFVDLYYRSEF